MPPSNLAILDTSVYIENFRTGRFEDRLTRSPWLVRVSAVVLHELRRGARTLIERRFVEDLRRNTRVITPTEGDWVRSAEIVAQLRRRRGYDANKLRGLAFDVLIALCARSIGAVVITCDRTDFAELKRYLAVTVLDWSEGAGVRL